MDLDADELDMALDDVDGTPGHTGGGAAAAAAAAPPPAADNDDDELDADDSFLHLGLRSNPSSTKVTPTRPALPRSDQELLASLLGGSPANRSTPHRRERRFVD